MGGGYRNNSAGKSMNNALIFVVFGGLAIALLTGMVPLSLVVAVAVGALLLILWRKNMRS
jgi:hypothetical protein